MRLASDKLIFTMVDTEVFVIANINQAIVDTPSIRMDDAVNIYIYDANGKLLTEGYDSTGDGAPDDNVYTYVYDANGFKTSATQDFDDDGIADSEYPMQRDTDGKLLSFNETRLSESSTGIGFEVIWEEVPGASGAQFADNSKFMFFLYHVGLMLDWEYFD